MRNRLFVAVSALVTALAVPSVASAQVFDDQGPSALPQGCSGSGCWTNYARVTDYDGDGDLDLVAVNNGGFFSTPQAQALVFWENDGAGTFTDDSAAHGNTVAPLRQVAFGDIDDDGDLDFFAPSAGGTGNDRLFINNAGAFTDEASTRLPASLSSTAGATRMGDVDNDGDLDILVANGYFGSAPSLDVYLNDGAGNFTVGPVPPLTGGDNPDDIDLVDVDGDFDLDVLVNFHEGQNALLKNDGAGNFTSASAGLPTLDDGAYHYGPAFCDVDGDGDRDYFVDNAGDDYREMLAINDGTGNFTDESAARIAGNSGADDNLVVCLDYDGDGDFDFVVGALSTVQRLFVNDGTGNFAFMPGAFDASQIPTLWLEAGDLNGDGRIDIFAAAGEGNPQTERFYLGTTEAAIDTVAPVIIGVESVSFSAAEESVVRFAVSDNAVTDEGPRLSRAYVVVDGNEADATFVGGDIFRAVVPATSATTFSVCAVDLEGNSGCVEATTSTGEGGGGQGGSGPVGGDSAGGNGAGNTPNNGGNSPQGGGGTDEGSEGGCDCQLPAQRQNGAGAFALLSLALAVGLRRRRV
jgi:MYXO-CTERM domain-containing protein